MSVSLLENAEWLNANLGSVETVGNLTVGGDMVLTGNFNVGGASIVNGEVQQSLTFVAGASLQGPAFIQTTGAVGSSELWDAGAVTFFGTASLVTNFTLYKLNGVVTLCLAIPSTAMTASNAIVFPDALPEGYEPTVPVRFTTTAQDLDAGAGNQPLTITVSPAGVVAGVSGANMVNAHNGCVNAVVQWCL